MQGRTIRRHVARMRSHGNKGCITWISGTNWMT
jgi:hypothetical protein